MSFSPTQIMPTDSLVHGMSFSSTHHVECTPLHTAVMNGSYKEASHSLSDPKCSIYARYNGKTALQYALDQHSTLLADLLVSRGARLSADDLTYYEPNDMDWAPKQPWKIGIYEALQSKPPLQALTDKDVTEVASLLVDRFHLAEPDIVDDILESAEFWSVTTMKRSEDVKVDENSTPEPYIASAPISGRPHQPVRRIVFKIVSNDQGWGGGSHSEPYKESWTWFEATSSSNPEPVEVQRNVRISKARRTHVVIWDMYSPPHIVQWLASLKPGDVVSLYPKALHFGWENSVASVEMRVYTSAL